MLRSLSNLYLPGSFHFICLQSSLHFSLHVWARGLKQATLLVVTGTSSKICVWCLYVFSYICVETNFVDLKNFAVSWLLCGISRRWIDVCFQPWWDSLTGLKRWTDNVKESGTVPELLETAFWRKDWKRISAESSLIAPNDPIGQRTELRLLLVIVRMNFVSLWKWH